MDINQLKAFDRVARDGSFTEAAARLNVTQATISMRIRALETDLDTQLFVRGRHVRLTDQGIGFLPYCRRMLGVLQEARETLRRAERGRISVASLSSMIMPLISDALLRFQRRHRETEVIVRDGRHNLIAAMLHEREVELAVMCWPNLDPLLTTVEPLLVVREDVLLVAAPDLAASLGPDPSLTEVLEKAPRYLNLAWWQAAPADAAAIALSAPVRVDLPTDPARSLVEAGEGVGLFVRSAVAGALKEGRLAEVRPKDLPPLFRNIALVVRETDALDQAHLLEFAHEIAAEGRQLGRVLKDVLPPPGSVGDPA
ncbi:LysR family transcriptional regulator [Rhodobacterales bacterium]|nr:LysR family transcriptional regulator [Rhodobacterales bacterium]